MAGGMPSGAAATAAAAAAAHRVSASGASQPMPGARPQQQHHYPVMAVHGHTPKHLQLVGSPLLHAMHLPSPQPQLAVPLGAGHASCLGNGGGGDAVTVPQGFTPLHGLLSPYGRNFSPAGYADLVGRGNGLGVGVSPFTRSMNAAYGLGGGGGYGEYDVEAWASPRIGLSLVETFRDDAHDGGGGGGGPPTGNGGGVVQTQAQQQRQYQQPPHPQAVP
eukprot:365027-Chlamydomonas_euryale.AAC.8